MPTFTPDGLGRAFTKLTKELGAKAMTEAVGKAAQKEAEKAASADLGGDPRFSGWAPELVTKYNVLGPGRISFHPTKKSAGPWTVAEYGRHATSGPTTRESSIGKTGRRKRAGARFRRWNGVTAGKRTATEALELIDKKLPVVVNEQVGVAIRKFFD